MVFLELVVDEQPLRRMGALIAGTDIRYADSILIRPDAHIAWAATIDEPADTAALRLREALSSWFGDLA